MQASECFDELSRVEACPPLTEFLILSQMIEELSSIEEVHHEVQFGWRLKCIVQLYDKWAIDLLKNVSFSYINTFIYKYN